MERIRQNVELIRDGFGALFENRPVLGALRDFRRKLRQWRFTESRSQPVYTEQPSVVEYDETREVKTEDGKTLRLYLNQGRVIYVEELEAEQRSEEQEAEQEKTGDVRATVSQLPSRLIERPQIRRRKGILQSLREYAETIVAERQLELEYQKFRLELLKRQVTRPPKREEKSEQGFHV